MPSDHALAVLRAMAESRKGIGDFRLLVGTYPGHGRLGIVVVRKGDRWRVDSYSHDGDGDVATEPPGDRVWAEWFEERLKRGEPTPLYVCDGKSVWENSDPRPGGEPVWKASRHIGPQDLMSGEGLGGLSGAPDVKIASLLFPDLSPRPGWGFEFDPKPADAPGCVLLKRSARLATAEPLVGHEWYYVDPAKGHVVVRAALFNLPPDAAGDPGASRTRQTIRMEDFLRTSRGFWYPAVIHDSRPAALAVDAGQDRGAIRREETTVRYHFDLAADLPESLFTIDAARAPENP
jgi:hypothetical protein